MAMIKAVRLCNEETNMLNNDAMFMKLYKKTLQCFAYIKKMKYFISKKHSKNIFLSFVIVFSLNLVDFPFHRSVQKVIAIFLR